MAGDFELLFAIDVFKAHITSLCASGRPPQRGVPLTVTTVSTYELVRTRSYPSSHSLGQHMSTVLMEDMALREFVADIRVNGKGMLTFTSHEHMTWHAVRGRLPCSQCGRFFNGPKGIRVHQMLNHNISFASAQGEALATDWQLVVYTAPPLLLAAATSHTPSTTTTTSPAATPQPAQPRASLAVPAPMAKVSNPGILAAQAGHTSVLIALVESGTWDPKSEDYNGCNALVWAAGAGHVAICQYLVTSCAVDAHVLQGKRDMRRSPLHWAARNGHINVCKYLVLELHVAVDSPTHDGTTAFHYAVWNNQLSTCDWLASVGQCNVHAVNSYGCNASQWACMTGSVDMLKFLHCHQLDFALINRNGHSALHKAAIKGHLEACRWLLNVAGLGWNHMQKDEDGFTPQRFAMENGHVELGAYLAQAEASLRTITA
ncbi:hypothetical protein H257_16856 [Aphanomyces astaci]|uniref:C2H2-type domain-containing protein n=1 Tax=Aphanomyces astaci TaxID=112090 RepID=W4FIV4_APHAT|nr:hypothetical protein H257_16856 [Aphanomyces astaci]ETV66769.1 hypothetical protein H257_16856 [Aphanomyces astaci]|eukprot:XP_009843745.1 hypothetical protein H257_16856 [Aphanomyces astaci]